MVIGRRGVVRCTLVARLAGLAFLALAVMPVNGSIDNTGLWREVEPAGTLQALTKLLGLEFTLPTAGLLFVSMVLLAWPAARWRVGPMTCCNGKKSGWFWVVVLILLGSWIVRVHRHHRMAAAVGLLRPGLRVPGRGFTGRPAPALHPPEFHPSEFHPPVVRVPAVPAPAVVSPVRANSLPNGRRSRATGSTRTSSCRPGRRSSRPPGRRRGSPG